MCYPQFSSSLEYPILKHTVLVQGSSLVGGRVLLYEYSIAPAHTQRHRASYSGTSRRHGLEDLQLQVLPHDLSLDARRHWRRARVRHLVQERLQRDAVRE